MRLARLFGVASCVCCAAVTLSGQSGRGQRRVAHLRRRSRPARATRRSIRSTPPTSTSSKSPGASRPTASARAPSSSSQATPLMVERRRLLRPPARAAPSSRSTPRPARCCGCTARTKARAATTAPRQLSGRGLAYWTDGREDADPLRHARLSAGRARREDRRAGCRLRQERHRRSEAGRRSGDRSRSPARSACTPTPVVAKDVVIVGAAHRAGGVPQEQDAT